MNILLNNVCNQKCPYCFAEDVLSDNAKSISIEDFNYYLKFLRLNEQKEVRILGGEPTLHEYFVYLLSRCHNEGLNTTIFSNGLIPKDVMEKLRSNLFNGTFILNINNKDSYTEENWLKIRSNIKALIETGNNVSISLNIYKENFDYGYLKELFEEFNSIRVLRLGICNPMVGQKKEKLVDYKNFKRIGKEIALMIEDLYINHGVYASFDCGVPICMFDGDDFKKISIYSLKKKSFSCFSNTQIDVDSSLNIFRCFPFADYKKVSLGNFGSIGEVHNWIEFNFKIFKENRNDMCQECQFNNMCSGLCAAHNYDDRVKELDEKDEYKNIIRKLYLKDYESIDKKGAYEFAKSMEDEFLKVFLDLHLDNNFKKAFKYVVKNEEYIKSNVDNRPEYWRFLLDLFLLNTKNSIDKKLQGMFPAEYSESIRVRNIKYVLNNDSGRIVIFNFEKDKFSFLHDGNTLVIGDSYNGYTIRNSDLIEFFKRIIGKKMSKEEVVEYHDPRRDSANINDIKNVLDTLEMHSTIKIELR